MRSLVLALLVTLLPIAAHSATRYVRDGGDGSSPTTSWAGAYDQLSDAEAAASRGDTIYVADGTYSGVTCNVSVSGSTLITIKKATESEHGTSTGWNSAYGDGQAVFTGTIRFMSGYWTFDGVTGGGPGSWETGFGFRVKRSGGGSTKCIHVQSASGSTSVSNVTIRHVDVENSGEDVDGNADNFYCVNADNLTVEYCWVHDTNRTCFLFDTNSKGMLIQYNLVSERHSTDGTHGEHMSINNCGLNAANVIRWNRFRNSTNTGTIVIKDSVQSGFEIYGNVFYTTNPARYFNSNGVVTDTTGDSTTGAKVFNNTFLEYLNGIGGAISPVSWDVSTGNEFRNNIVLGGYAAATGTTRSFNLYTDGAVAGGETGGQNFASDIDTLLTDIDAEDFALLQATSAGTDTGSTVAGNDVDSIGLTRGADGTWDRGALEFDEGGSDVTAPTVTITGPTSASSYLTSSSAITVSGSAADETSLASVAVTMSGATAGSVSITGTTSWTGDAMLNPGVTVFTAVSTDASDNDSTADVLTVTYQPSTGTISAPQSIMIVP